MPLTPEEITRLNTVIDDAQAQIIRKTQLLKPTYQPTTVEHALIDDIDADICHMENIVESKMLTHISHILQIKNRPNRTLPE